MLEKARLQLESNIQKRDNQNDAQAAPFEMLTGDAQPDRR
jgi:hypothetical protein